MKQRRMKGNTLEIVNDNGVMISLSEEMVNNEMHIAVSGELTNEVAHEFEDEMMAAFSVCNVVKIDMGKVSYIASLALRALLSVQQLIDENDDAALIISNISPAVREMFESSGFDNILNIED